MVGLAVGAAALIALTLGFIAGAAWAMQRSRAATEAASTVMASLVRQNAELERQLAECLAGGRARRNGRHP